jgi:predicted phosphohydrolase
MSIFAIADTHLSGNPPAKPMTVFGDHWQDHWRKISEDWRKKVSPDDIVLLAGDISWAMKLDEALVDLGEIAALPGKKIICRGNHDYWWQTIGKMTAATAHKLFFIHNNFVGLGDIAVCGSRGWLCPGDPFFSTEDMPIYLRELNRTQLSLSAARNAGFKRIILMLHYPPLYSGRTSGFTELIAEFGVDICIYGHLHNEAIKNAFTGILDNTTYHLVSCDALDFKLKKIL